MELQLMVICYHTDIFSGLQMSIIIPAIYHSFFSWAA